MNIAHIEEQSFIYGPGRRFVIWVQGCSIHCKGCWNKEMWSFTSKNVITIDELITKIKHDLDLIEGVTLLGGEPIDQFIEVSELFSICKQIGLSTMLFTGYEISEIEAKEMRAIFDCTDILITGRYDETKRTMNHQWIGSTNQEIHFLSERHSHYQIENNNYIEITINEDGSSNILGFPDDALLKDTIQ